MNINFDILTFDYIILILTSIIVIFSFWKGFINSILGLLTWVGSVFITIFSYEYLSNFINDILLNISFLSDFDQLNYIVSIIIAIPLIFLLSLFILKRVRKLLSNDLDRRILGLILDKFFGTIYGLLFAYIIYSAILYFTNNNEIQILKNFNIFLIDNSNILGQINLYNENIIGNYLNNSNEL